MRKITERVANRGGKIARRAPVRFSILSVLSSLLLPPALAGCAPVGAVLSKVVGEPPVAPRYVLDKAKPILVLVENYQNPDAGRLDAQRVTIYVAEELGRYRVGTVVAPEDVEALRSRADYRSMKVEEVGRAAGAGQVLYVNMRPLKVENTVGGEMLKAGTELRVRVVDVETGQTLWPRDTPQGQTVVAQSPWVRSPTGGREGLPEPALREQVARSAAHQLVKLFRKWRPDDERQDLEETVR